MNRNFRFSFLSLFMIIILLYFIIPVIPISTKQQQGAINYFYAYMNALKIKPHELIGEEANILNEYNILNDSDNVYSCVIIQELAKHWKFHITDMEENNGEQIVQVHIESIPVSEVFLSDKFFTEYIKNYDHIKEDNYTSFCSSISNIIIDDLRLNKNTASTDVTIHMAYNNGWEIDVTEDFISAMFGDINSDKIDIVRKFQRFNNNSDANEIIAVTTTSATTSSISTTTSMTTTTTSNKNTVVTEKTTNTNIQTTTILNSTSTTSYQTTSISTTTTITTTAPIQEFIYKADEETFKDELPPNDTEQDNLSDNNKTTRSSRKKPVKLGETALFDNTDYFASSGKYALNLKISEIYKGSYAEDILEKNKESYSIKKNEKIILFKLDIELLSNDTGNDTIQISYLDFDLVDYQNKKKSPIRLKNMLSFNTIKVGEKTSGYICFKYNEGDNINLAFKEALDNTIWFSIIK